MEPWVHEALNGNVEYFEMNMDKNNRGRFVDAFGMTPLMYAVVGESYCNSDKIRRLARISDKTMRNCLGHTAYDVFLCIADTQAEKEVLDLLNPFAVVKKTAKKLGSIFDIGMAILSEVTETNVYTDLGDDSMGLVNAAKKFRNKNLTSLDGLSSKLQETRVAREDAAANYNNAVQSQQMKIDQLFEKKYNERHENANANYAQHVEKDEFETMAEYEARVKNLLETVNDSELIPDEDVQQLRVDAEQEIRAEIEHCKNLLTTCDATIQQLEQQCELLLVYAFPSTSPTIGRYDAEEQVFPINYGRHTTKIHIPREAAKQFKQDFSQYSVRPSTQRVHMNCSAQLFFELGDQTYQSDCLKTELLGYSVHASSRKPGEPEWDELDIEDLVALLCASGPSGQVKTKALIEFKRRITTADDTAFTDYMNRYAHIPNSSITNALSQEKARRWG